MLAPSSMPLSLVSSAAVKCRDVSATCAESVAALATSVRFMVVFALAVGLKVPTVVPFFWIVSARMG